MEALKAELERKRKQKEAEFGGRKYVKRSEIEAARKAAKNTGKAAAVADDIPGADILAAERAASAVVASTTKVTEAGSSADGGEKQEQSTSKRTKREMEAEEQIKREPLAKEEVVRRLRALGEPATLFGETDHERHRRLIIAAMNIQIDDIGGGQQANELHAKMRALDAEAKRLAVMRKKRKEEEDEAAEAAAAEEGEPKSELEKQFEKAAMELARKRAAKNMTVGDRISHFFKNIMKEWETEIDKMPDEYLTSTEGKLLRATFDLTLKNLTHMYKMLSKDRVPEDLKRGLWLIVESMQRRDYRDAMDVYLRCAIGNAPWPIGVTMVGIHDRSAREKIGVNSSAHIMQDEATRKMLNGVKRCISFCQRRFPANPSRTVDFNLRVFGNDLASLHEAEEQGQVVDVASKDHNIPKDKWGNYVDGWKAQTRDNRTQSAVLKSAYKTEDDVKIAYGETQIVMK